MLRPLLLPFVKNPEFWQQLRTAYVVKRLYKAPLPSSGRAPSLRKRHFVYETLQENLSKSRQLTVLLKEYVPDVGMPGEIVSLKEKQARFLLLTKAAVYSSEESIASAETTLRQQESYSSRFSGTTVKLLSNFVLNISMNRDEPWTVEPWHVRSAFRKAHLHVPEYAFTMPKEAINGPDMNLEGKEFYTTVTINGKETVTVRCRIHHWTARKEHRIPPVRDHWKFPAETIFPEDKVLQDTLSPMIPPILIEDEGPPHMRPKVSTARPKRPSKSKK